MSDHTPLSALDGALPFVERHIGLRPADVSTMLERLGFESLEALMDAAVPGGIRPAAALDLPAALSEDEAARELRAIAAANRPGEAMIGLGYHATITPPVIRRNVLEDPELVHRLHAVPARDLPGPARGAAQLPDRGGRPHRPAHRERLAAGRGHRRRRGDDAGAPRQQARLRPASWSTPTRCPQTIDVVRTRAEAMGIEVVVADLSDGLPEGGLSGVLVQYPGASGRILDPRPVIEADPRAGRAGRRRRRPAGADRCSRPPAPSAPTSSSAPPSASASRSSTAARTPATWPSRRTRAAPARPPGRGLRRRRGPRGVPPGAADPRAAHPPRQGDLQHLHRAGAARRRGPMYAVYHGPEGLRAIATRTHRYAAVLAAALERPG